MVAGPRDSCSCSCGWYPPDIELAPADAWWKEAIRHETENRWYVRQLPGSWAATFGGSQVDALIKHQVEVPSDRSFRPGRRVLPEPRESQEFKRAMLWEEEGVRQEPLPRQLPQSPVDVPPAKRAETVLAPVTEPTTVPSTQLEPVTAMVETVKDPMSPEVVKSLHAVIAEKDSEIAALKAQLERSTEGPERTEAKTLVPSKVIRGKSKAAPKKAATSSTSRPRLGHWSLLRQSDVTSKTVGSPAKTVGSVAVFKPPRRSK